MLHERIIWSVALKKKTYYNCDKTHVAPYYNGINVDNLDNVLLSGDVYYTMCILNKYVSFEYYVMDTYCFIWPNIYLDHSKWQSVVIIQNKELQGWTDSVTKSVLKLWTMFYF